MSDKWPQVTVLKRGAMKGGGDRGAKKVAMVQITLRTEMKCGAELEETTRCRKEDERYNEGNLRDNLGIRARAHLRSCNKCQNK